MALLCQKCNQEIKTENINVATNVAFCAVCAEVFKLSELSQQSPQVTPLKQQVPEQTKKPQHKKPAIIAATVIVVALMTLLVVSLAKNGSKKEDSLSTLVQKAFADSLSQSSGNTAVVPITQDYQGKREVLDWYQAIGIIRTKSSDPLPASISVEPVLGYKQADKTTLAEITSRQLEIKDFIRQYFTEKTSEELRPQNEEKIRIEIRNTINDDILTTSKIRDVKFLSFDIVDQ